MNVLVIFIGLGVLVYFAVVIGVSLDTESQRRGAFRVAEERRRLVHERKAMQAAIQDCRGCRDCPLQKP